MSVHEPSHPSFRGKSFREVLDYAIGRAGGAPVVLARRTVILPDGSMVGVTAEVSPAGGTEVRFASSRRPNWSTPAQGGDNAGRVLTVASGRRPDGALVVHHPQVWARWEGGALALSVRRLEGAESPWVDAERAAGVLVVDPDGFPS